MRRTFVPLDATVLATVRSGDADRNVNTVVGQTVRLGLCAEEPAEELRGMSRLSDARCAHSSHRKGARQARVPEATRRPSTKRAQRGSHRETRSSLTTEALGLMVPASYFVKARGPPPSNSPASSWERPSRSRIARTSSGSILVSDEFIKSTIMVHNI